MPLKGHFGVFVSDPVTIIEAAIARLHDDVGVIVEPTVVAAFSILRTTDLPTYLRLRHKAKETNKGCLVTELDRAVQQSLPGGGDEPSALDELVAGALLRYPVYLSRITGRPCAPEQALDELLQWRGFVA